jgi:NAD(P)-dependent dehydrogenase (short-subunit alcohol dehydrogenase family)
VRPARLDSLEKDLVERGVEAYGVTADLADTPAARAAAAAITDRFGTPDVLLYSPGDVSRLPVGALDLDAEELLTWLPLHLLTPIALVRSVLPDMLARGSGALLFAQGASARVPMPALGSVGVAQSGLLNYLHALAAEVGPRGIYVGTMLIGALIERSAAAGLWDGGGFAAGRAAAPDRPGHPRAAVLGAGAGPSGRRGVGRVTPVGFAESDATRTGDPLAAPGDIRCRLSGDEADSARHAPPPPDPARAAGSGGPGGGVLA